MWYMVRKLNAVPASRNWLSIRLSYGMNGILLPTLYLPSLTKYLRSVTHLLTQPSNQPLTHVPLTQSTTR